MTSLQRLALTAFGTVMLLLFMGALVRVTGSGLGCPDWPFCYGRMVPPTQAEQIDFSKLDIERFRRKAVQHGRDAASITPASIRAEFNATHTWIEFINRLTSMPVGLSVLALLVAAWRKRRAFPSVLVAAVASFLLVGINAWLGAKVVFSGLKPGIITVHMALAVLLLLVLVYAAWRATDKPWSLTLKDESLGRRARKLGTLLLGLILLEGILGSQVREMTDQLAKLHYGQARDLWTAELEQTWVYLVHRSGSWLLLITSLLFYHQAGRSQTAGAGWLEKSITGLVLAQMVLGVVLSHVGVLPTAQLLHVVLSSLLVSGLFLWLLGSQRPRLHV